MTNIDKDMARLEVHWKKSKLIGILSEEYSEKDKHILRFDAGF